MPIFTYMCSWGHRTEDLVPPDTRTIKCHCGRRAKKVPSQIQPHRLPLYDQPQNEMSNRKQRNWIESESVQARLKSGDLVMAEDHADES